MHHLNNFSQFYSLNSMNMNVKIIIIIMMMMMMTMNGYNLDIMGKLFHHY